MKKYIYCLIGLLVIGQTCQATHPRGFAQPHKSVVISRPSGYTNQSCPNCLPYTKSTVSRGGITYYYGQGGRSLGHSTTSQSGNTFYMPNYFPNINKDN